MEKTHSWKTTLCLALLAVFLVFGIGIYQPLLSPISEYEYPITNASPDWKSYSVHEKVEMLRIPENVLRRMTDKALVRAIAEFPYLIDIGLYGNFPKDYDTGIQRVQTYCSAMDKLLSKKNAAEILERYSTEVIAEMKEAEPGRYFQYCYPEEALAILEDYARRSVNYPPIGSDYQAFYEDISDEELLRQVIECRFLAAHTSLKKAGADFTGWQYISESCPPLRELLSRETALESLRTYGPPLIGQCAAAQEETPQRDSLEALENLIYSCCPELNPSGE